MWPMSIASFGQPEDFHINKLCVMDDILKDHMDQ